MIQNGPGYPPRSSRGVQDPTTTGRNGSITAISSAIFSRWSALLPLLIACSTQCDDVVAQHLLLDPPQRAHRPTICVTMSMQ